MKMKNALLLSITVFHLFSIGFLMFGPTSFAKKRKLPLVVRTLHPTPSPSFIAASKTHVSSQQSILPPSSQPKRPTPPKPPQTAEKKEPAMKEVQPAKTPPPPKPPQTAEKKEPAIKEVRPAKTPPPKPLQTAEKKEPVIKEVRPAKTPLFKSPLPPPAPRAAISDALLKELQQEIENLDQTTPKEKNRTFTPPQPLKLKIDQLSQGFATSPTPSSFVEQLTTLLHEKLCLPEYGEVKVELTLHPEGKIAKVSILEAKSEKNKRYLENELTKIRFPKLDTIDLDQNEKTLILTFCNE